MSIAEVCQSRGSLTSLSLRRRPGRPTANEAGRLQDDILDAAFRNFVRHGFEAASMEGIAREAGVARITLYRHFESKEALFVSMARRVQLRIRRPFEEPFDMTAPLDKALHHLIGMLYDAFTQSDYMATMRMVSAESDRFPKLGRAMLSDVKEFSVPIVRYLSDLHQAGLACVDSPIDAASQLMGLASGAGRYLLMRPSRHPTVREHWIASLSNLFYNAWRPQH